MRATVCQLSNNMDLLDKEWEALVGHVKSEGSEMVLLPEMPFYPWIAQTDQVDAGRWQESVDIHDHWISRLEELKPAIVMSTRPVIREEKRLNEAYVWESATGYTAAHHKYYLPDEPGWWEASWYERGEKDFTAVQSRLGRIGFLICTEIWSNHHARDYARQGIDLLVCPRATESGSTETWIAGGRTAAFVSGAFCLSSNFRPSVGDAMQWGGSGWIIEPEGGRVLGVTSEEWPFLTKEIDLSLAEKAKHTYPRYVLD